jgi:hypothetical protein
LAKVLVPKDQRTKDKEDKADLADTFHARMQEVVDRYQDRDHPYFILFRAEQSPLELNKFTERFVMYVRKPPFLANSMVFFVDNRKELLLWLWTCSHDKKLRFNKQLSQAEAQAFESAADFQRAFYQEARAQGQDKEEVVLRA